MQGDGWVENRINKVELQIVADLFIVLLLSVNTQPSIIVQKLYIFCFAKENPTYWQ